MRIISVNTLKEYWEKHPDSRLPLYEWYNKVDNALWESFTDIKNDFNSVDFVGNQHYIFNIKGNRYRLVTAIKFVPKLVYIRFVGNHSEYDKIDVQNI